MLSNVPGPQQLVHVAGIPLDNMEFFLFGAIGVYIGVFSYNGQVSCTANFDTKVGADPHKFADLFPVAFLEIYDGVCSPKPASAPAETEKQPAADV